MYTYIYVLDILYLYVHIQPHLYTRFKWTSTDNLAFVPISFDFMMGSGTPMGSVADAHVRKNFKNYSVCVECADADKRIVLPVATFVKVCEIDWEL